MLRYIAQRIFQLIPVIIGISLITFTLSFIIPGDPVRSIMGQRSDRDAELRIMQKFGLDRPWYVQYLIWARNLVRNPGELPSFKMRVSGENGTEVYELKFSPDTVFASENELRDVSNEPFSRQVLTHLIERGCTPLGEMPSTGGTTWRLISIDESPDGTTAILDNYAGSRVTFQVDPGVIVCSDGLSGGIENAEIGKEYTGYFRSEGFLSGREFTAIFDTTERVLIDGMFDAASVGASDVSQLQSPAEREITGRERKGGRWFFEFEDEAGNSERHEMMSNAVLMLGGNRSEADEFRVGDKVMLALTMRQDNTLHALFDETSTDLREVNDAIEAYPDSTMVAGKITETVLSPAVWFDFGRSYRQQREVKDIIKGSFVNTMYLSSVAMIIAIIIGIFAGIVSAIKPYSFVDYLTMTGALIGVSMPVFWLGLMLILLFQGQLHWISGVGYGEIKWYAINLGLFELRLPWHQQVILPSITLATVPMAIIARMTRSSMLEVMNLDYIRTARAKGLSEWTVIMKHALKNSLIPIVTVIGVDFAILLAGAVLTETVFSWPGLGREIVAAIEFRDFPVVMAGVVLFAFVFVFVNLIVDILYAYIDPRIRYQ